MRQRELYERGMRMSIVIERVGGKSGREKDKV